MLIDNKINEAIRMHQSGQLVKAVDLYRSIIQIAPGNQVVLALMSNIAQSYFQLSQILVQMGRIPDAISSLKSVLSVREDVPDAQFQLGQLLIRSGDKEQAAEHLRFYLRLVPEDKAGAVMLLAHIGEEKIPDNSPHSYVKQYYANYAHSYDEHLINRLDYKCPQIIFEAMKFNGIENADILDIGCGTGLSGDAVKSLARSIDGVDLSQEMLSIARQRNVYKNLDAADIYAYLSNKINRYDVIIAAGVFEHIGEPEKIFRLVIRALRKNGFFIFTADENIDDGVTVNDSGFYMHGKLYLEQYARQSGFLVISNKSIYIRRENNNPVSGLTVVLKKSI